jgi:hypothetical protein
LNVGRQERRQLVMMLHGVGHYLPAAVYPQVAGEARALAD